MHGAFVGRVAGNAPGEDQPAGAIDFAIDADVVDVLTLPPHEKGERSADPCVDCNAQHLLVAQGRTKHPTPNPGRLEPGVKDTLRWRGESTSNANNARLDTHGNNPVCPPALGNNS